MGIKLMKVDSIVYHQSVNINIKDIVRFENYKYGLYRILMVFGSYIVDGNTYERVTHYYNNMLFHAGKYDDYRHQQNINILIIKPEYIEQVYGSEKPLIQEEEKTLNKKLLLL